MVFGLYFLERSSVSRISRQCSGNFSGKGGGPNEEKPVSLAGVDNSGRQGFSCECLSCDNFPCDNSFCDNFSCDWFSCERLAFFASPTGFSNNPVVHTIEFFSTQTQMKFEKANAMLTKSASRSKTNSFFSKFNKPPWAESKLNKRLL